MFKLFFMILSMWVMSCAIVSTEVALIAHLF
nr:MAG TPA: REV protein [Caudoviricetes sp.]DAS45169.1 MAG TPA: REV protein [Caudoviricetes sp.]DAU48146.1 MAG TPA: REV protein [Caudoviricetes sp.]